MNQSATVSSSSSLAVIILAAGKGTRMNNPNKAKVMFELSGEPMIDFVVRQAESLHPAKIAVVVGFQKESVMQHLDASFHGLRSAEVLHYAHQDQQLGTGHAVMQTESALQSFSGDVLILSGDVPLLRIETLQDFAAFHRDSKSVVSVLSVENPNPTGYGRIVRAANGDFERIVEHKDASEQERSIKEINSGIYFVQSSALFQALHQVSNSNAQGEYYLTDIVSIVRASDAPVAAWKCTAFEEVQGINTVEQLEDARRALEEQFA
ncbi:MAG: UDP-N-acetylglucosamine pyrophosphorylase [Candidatus Kapaibacterium sp.]|nr:MAG: UDP-N-acetylglucosamine pyrophosphorylase [Candidatus Kapabacteria bacterium]